MSRSDFSCGVESRDGKPWAIIRRNGEVIFKIGPYASEKEARSSARFRLAQHYNGSFRLCCPTIEQTPIGPQYVLPGAERVSDAELAKRKATATLQARKAQAPCDIGLFSDAAAQIDLINLARKS